MKKKIILLNISKSSAEIDWILPVLFELNSKYRIYTIFQSLNAYRTLEKDKNFLIYGMKFLIIILLIINLTKC